jgi:hypothetical protein
LGLTPLDNDGYLVDAWGGASNRIRYAVASDSAVTSAKVTHTYPYTKYDGMRDVSIPELKNVPQLYHVCGSGVDVEVGVSCKGAATLTNKAVAVLWSAGGNAATGGTTVDEAQNPNPNGGSADRLFVSHPQSDNATNPFDDLVTWLGLYTLVNRMVTAGQLP